MLNLSPNRFQINERRLKDMATFSFFTFVLMVGMIEPASASLLDKFAETALKILNGKFLRLIAICAVIFVGLSAFRGQLDWMKAIIVIGGIVIIFGAAGIVDYIKDNAGTI